MSDDGLQIIESGLTVKYRADAIAIGDDPCRVTGPAAGALDAEVDIGDALDRLDHLQDGKAAPISAIERHGSAAAAQIGKGI